MFFDGMSVDCVLTSTHDRYKYRKVTYVTSIALRFRSDLNYDQLSYKQAHSKMLIKKVIRSCKTKLCKILIS
jgi:hypothetical protein